MKLSVFLTLTLPVLAQQPTPEQGQITTTGKFQPAGKSGLPAKKEIEGQFRIKELDKKRVQIGEVVLDREARTITFSADLAVRDQVLEYLLVHENGKVHESLLSTKISAHDIHLAVLLLAANGQSPTIHLTWKKNGPDAKIPLSELIEAKDSTPKLSSADWIYIGSSFDSKGFIAQREGSFITLLNDSAALISHKIASKIGRDDVYFPITKKLPGKGVPVKVVLGF